MVNRSLIDDTVKLLANSLAGETQAVYFRNWDMRTRFCDAREISPCVDTAKHNWDVDILCFLTWAHTVIRNGCGASSTRFSAIGYLHLLQGKGDFEGESFRISALVNAAKRKRGVDQRLPTNPEMLEKGKSMLNMKTASRSELWAVLMMGFHFAMGIGK